ncbi:hypothetical protein [Ottowia thiooxydans]|uniref:hypothetical protein n=1 Tax=Ottowia thiooxydans TaxID=219182 RepID=UPI00040EAB88|nr:hypothetical protein [Ottowia thiooxydans]
MPYAKTDLAAVALKHRDAAALSQRQRAALIMFDGRRSAAEVLRHTSGLGVNTDDIAYLLNNGLLREEIPAPLVTQDAANDSKPSPLTVPASLMSEIENELLTPDEQKLRYQAAYPLATQLTATLGLRGFKLNLAVERADGYVGLRQLLPKIEAAVGADRAAALRKALTSAPQY